MRCHSYLNVKKSLVSIIASECESAKDITAVLKQLFAGTLEQMLESEMDEH
jgi:putative transposase